MQQSTVNISCVKSSNKTNKKNFVPFFEPELEGATYTRINTVHTLFGKNIIYLYNLKLQLRKQKINWPYYVHAFFQISHPSCLGIPEKKQHVYCMEVN